MIWIESVEVIKHQIHIFLFFCLKVVCDFDIPVHLYFYVRVLLATQCSRLSQLIRSVAAVIDLVTLGLSINTIKCTWVIYTFFNIFHNWVPVISVECIPPVIKRTTLVRLEIIIRASTCRYHLDFGARIYLPCRLGIQLWVYVILFFLNNNFPRIKIICSYCKSLQITHFYLLRLIILKIFWVILIYFRLYNIPSLILIASLLTFWQFRP